MPIQTFSSGPFATNSYLLSSLPSRECVIIDTPPDVAPLLIDYITAHNLSPKKILLTHSHWDHIAAANELKHHYHLPVAIHPADKENLENPGSDLLPCWIEFPPLIPDEFLEEGAHIKVGEFDFVVIHTPGHSPGSICLYDAASKVLFSGDTLFQGTIGNLSFPTSRPDLMWGSLKKLALLPKETRVYPGHGGMTTIGQEGWLSRAEEMFG